MRHVIGTSMLAVATVAGLVAGAGQILPSASAASTPKAAVSAHRAPREFNPADAYLSFGWLPKGTKLTGGSVIPQAAVLIAGPKPLDLHEWNVQTIAAGQCHVRAHTLTCSRAISETVGGGLKLSTRAPNVRGHRAYWANGLLIWRWARNAWATLSTPSDRPGPATRRNAVRVARHVAYGAPTRPLEFSVQLSKLPRKWHLGAVFWQVDRGRFRVIRFGLLTHPTQNADGGIEFQRNLPAFSDMDPALPKTMRQACGLPANRTINGYRVRVVTNVNGQDQYICANKVDGLFLQLGAQGSHLRPSPVALFRSHLRLLGNNPKNWTTQPVK
jgi:hypothetical protein